MNRKMTTAGIATLLFCLVPIAMGANPKPNFSGAWVMDGWIINSDGELAITMFIDSPNGSYETRRIFLKK